MEIEVELYREKDRQEYIHTIHHMHCILSCGNHTGYFIVIIEVEGYREKFRHNYIHSIHHMQMHCMYFIMWKSYRLFHCNNIKVE